MEEHFTQEHRQYRIRTPTMAIYTTVDGQRTTATVPVGMIVFTTQSHLDGDVLIEVSWNDRKYLMFTQDLRERSEPVP